MAVVVRTGASCGVVSSTPAKEVNPTCVSTFANSGIITFYTIFVDITIGVIAHKVVLVFGKTQ